ncbi:MULTISPECIES: BREX-3 system P-loop-containing protein BrxF [Brevibacillus]|uniref:BREX-3 system P-loop-containing protein BrxF n=1 Tax=Brevibacillus TaxID=55080 RepID=UPI00156AC6BF|nr:MULTISPECIES: BREX-3 system P-loop-containing protein BrxF [Brevibacillus]UED70181.1 BREX-3 system P-loop-containing protein BrxF [Brevibacillus sp. HD3.3A]WDV96479.1 BREX-3 system P-loop-containing protein BrxF [Brevibacillus parabrevis]
MSLTERIERESEQIRGQRHQLLFISCNTLDEKSLLEHIQSLQIPIYNLSLELSRHLKEFTVQKRQREVSTHLRQLVNTSESEIVCFEKIEYIFDPELKQDPLRLFESISGNVVVIVVWPGNVEGSTMTYAVPGHPEHTTLHVQEENIIKL